MKAVRIYTGADNKKLVAGFGTLLGNTFADIDGDGRADLIADTGGRLVVDAANGSGTRVHVEVPLQ